MNSGAIKFSEPKWVSMHSAYAVDLMIWLDNNLEPGYTIYKLPTGETYFVGESETLFETLTFNQKYPIYEILHENAKFSLRKTLSSFNL